MRRRDLLLPAAAAVLSSCARKKSGPLREIRFGAHPFPNMSVFYLALEKGYFRDAGFDVRPQVAATAQIMASLLAAGQVDGACTFASPALFNLASGGATLRIVLGREVVSPACGDAGAIYVRRKSFPKGTSDIRLWEGKRFSTVGRAGLGEFFLDSELSAVGLDPSKTPRTNLGHPEMVAALISGGVDAAMNAGHVPYNFSSHPEIVREDAGLRALTGLQFSYIWFGKGLIESDPKAGAALLAAYLRAGRDFLAGATPQFLKDYAAASNLGANVIDGCRRTFTQNGEVDRKSVARIVQWAIARGYSPATTSADPLIDARYWELAMKSWSNA
ncbi:MAG: ABC transporter substrate-binding protein [Acidobacteriia bacterium]|nr:ABC transporter substrate-binding protein [Terriglobia bacterium]